MGFGSGREWGLGEDENDEIIQRAIDLGISFFDTANIYSRGEIEEILGSSLEGHEDDWQVVSTKGHRQMDPDNPNFEGLSRKALQQDLDHSLERLRMDAVDIYFVHASDPATGIETTMRTLDDIISDGKARYLGASSMWTWEFAEAMHTTDRRGFGPFTVMQNHYSPAYQEEERDMLPFCDLHDAAVILCSPLARGYLTRPDDRIEATDRGSDEAEEYDHTYHKGGGREINRRVEELAEDTGVSMAQIALARQFHKGWVDAPILGVSSFEHLEDAVEALEISLSDSGLQYLEEPYEPSEIAGHNWPEGIYRHR